MANPIKYFSTNDLLYLLTLLKSEYEKYVEAVSGYGLISDADLAKLGNIEAGAQVNVLEGIIVGSTEQTITNKKITLGTAAGMDVTNTYSASGTTPVTGQAVAAALATITGIRFESYSSFAELPAVGENGVIYLVPNGGSGSNVKDEYFWNSTTSAYEKFGTTDIDLTNYVQFNDLVELTQAEVLAAWNSVFGS